MVMLRKPPNLEGQRSIDRRGYKGFCLCFPGRHNGSEAKWLQQAMQHGTVADKVAAMTLLVEVGLINHSEEVTSLDHIDCTGRASWQQYLTPNFCQRYRIHVYDGKDLDLSQNRMFWFYARL